jgi:hypothetical protein
MTLNPKEAESLTEKIKEVLEGHMEILLAYIWKPLMLKKPNFF